jgi:hypothetical protein
MGRRNGADAISTDRKTTSGVSPRDPGEAKVDRLRGSKFQRLDDSPARVFRTLFVLGVFSFRIVLRGGDL